jgi:hypothetical protein
VRYEVDAEFRSLSAVALRYWWLRPGRFRESGGKSNSRLFAATRQGLLENLRD